MTLSPYIFILCHNILSLLFLEDESNQNLHSIKISRGSPPLSHLFFADDCFVFFRTNVHSCRTVKSILHEFCMLSGQLINFKKFELFLSPNCTHQKRRWFSGILRVKTTSKPSRYLGVEIGLMNQKKAFFQPLLDKFNNKLAG